MKRISPVLERFTLGFGLLLMLVLVLIPARADDVTPAVANPPSPASVANTNAVDAKKETGEAKSGSTEAKKENPESLLIELFKKEENVTNSLGTVMVWMQEGYRVAQYEVTQAQYQEIMKDNPSKFQGSQNPVDSITLNDANLFCKKLTELEIADKKLPKGYHYSLPSEQHWEAYVDEADLKAAVTSYYGDRKNPESVGTFPPNKFGLYDTRGNVWDLCDSGVGRGGSWRSFEDYVFIQFRYVVAAGQRFDDVGFRIILQGAPEAGPPLSTTQPQPPKPATGSY